MDEILINDKKYISSKQAAKVTGYAKDYIGQLCREGRVPARLVGRSWYVLESAIQDHRFGNPEPKSESKIGSTTIEWAHETPRYEAAPIEPLPPINKPKNVEIETTEEHRDNENGPESLQSSWKNWFDRAGETVIPTKDEKEVESEQGIEVQEQPEEPIMQEIEQDTEVNIPIHTIYRMPPREILPHYTPQPRETIEYIGSEEPVVIREGSSAPITIKLIGIVLAIAIGSIAILGSGYLDLYASIISKVSQISGLEVYNK